MRISLALLALSVAINAHATQPPVQICLGDSYEWPPYSFWERVNGEPEQSRLTGYSATLVLKALENLGLDYRIHYMPWARAQQELADFASKGRCEMTWDASFNSTRAGFLYYSVPLYKTRLGLFYSRKRFAEPPQLTLPDDLRQLKVCGVIGFNYQPYGIDWPLERLPTIQQNLEMLDRQRCDFFPSEIEPLLGGITIGTYSDPGQLTPLPLPQQKTFYLMISKGSPRAHELINRLNQIIIEQQETGEAQRLLERFLPGMQ